MTDDCEGLTNLLGAIEGEGVYLDSSGFSIDRLKAREKLSRYQLGANGLWLVKLVQSAVVSGAAKLRISFGRRETKVAFVPEQAWEADSLIEALFSDRATGDRGLDHLATALLGASGGLSQTLRWSVGSTSVKLGSEGPEVARIPSQEEFFLQATRPPRGVAWSRLLVAPLEQILRQTLEEWSAVSARCWVSSVPIELDGRPLRRGYDAVPQCSLHSKVPRRITGLHRVLGSRALERPLSRPALPCSGDEASEIEISSDRGMLDRHSQFLRWRPAGFEPRGWLSLHSSALVGPTVDLVCDGVVVESRLIEPMVDRMRECGLAARPLLMPRYVFAVNPDELDLSGFACRELDHLQLVRECLDESLALVSLVEERLGEYRARAADEMVMIRHGLKVLREMYDRVA